MEDSYPAEQSVIAPPLQSNRAESARHYRPANDDARGWPAAAPPVDDLNVGEQDDNSNPATGWADGFSWIDDAPTPPLMVDQGNLSPELAWTDLGPTGPNMSPDFYQQANGQVNLQQLLCWTTLFY